MSEFIGQRSELYKEALKEFPHARDQDIEVMKKYLNPQKDEIILEVGAGSGVFSSILSDSVKELIVSDPSKEQLDEVKDLNKTNITLIEAGADKLDLKEDSVDAIWSFGAMHHCFDKISAFKNFSRILKSGGRVVIGDVWSGSSLAKHFDDKVAKYCVTGHEVAFWTDEFAESLCFLTSFKNLKIDFLDLQWIFDSKEDIGDFLYKIHAMTKTTSEDCLKGAEEILGIEEKDGKFCLNWPMKVLVAEKE